MVAKKQLLPSYDVFDETRYFSPANRSGICRSIGEIDLGVTVCEDAWQAAGLTPPHTAKTRLKAWLNGVAKE